MMFKEFINAVPYVNLGNLVFKTHVLYSDTGAVSKQGRPCLARDTCNSYIPAKWCVSAIHARGGAEGMYELIHTIGVAGY